MSVFDESLRRIMDRFSYEPPLLEVSLDELARQMQEQHECWVAAKSEADQAVAIADDERAKLDLIMAEYFARQKAARS